MESKDNEKKKFERDLAAANPFNLVLIFVIGAFLIIIWLFSLLPIEKYNTLSLLFGIWMILWGLVLVKLRYKQFEEGFYWRLPHCLNCIIPYDRCEDGGFEAVTITHFVGYIIVGYIVPDLYGEILLISILFEIFESLIGFTPKILLDPTVNMLGYIIGSYMSSFSSIK